MLLMKKALVLSLATLAMAAQANAAGADVRGTDRRGNETRDGRETDVAHTVGHDSRGTVATDLVNVDRSGLVRLSPSQKKGLADSMSDATIHASLSEALSQANNTEARPLLAAQIEGLSNLKGIDHSQNAQAVAALSPTARAEQSYFTLVTSVAKAARSWKGQSRDVATLLLVKTNANIAKGQSRGDALLAAKTEVETETKLKINLDDIFKLCKI